MFKYRLPFHSTDLLNICPSFQENLIKNLSICGVGETSANIIMHLCIFAHIFDSVEIHFCLLIFKDCPSIDFRIFKKNIGIKTRWYDSFEEFKKGARIFMSKLYYLVNRLFEA